MAAAGSGRHQLLKCVKLPRDVEAAWRDLKRYIATGAAPPGVLKEVRAREAMSVKFKLPADYSPVTSC
jgi:hypothetical protein